MRLLGVVLASLLLLVAGCGGGGPEPPRAADVEWRQYAPEVRDRVDAAVEASDCDGLQEQFDLANEGNDAHMAKFGNNNADLMEYIWDWMAVAGCR